MPRRSHDEGSDLPVPRLTDAYLETLIVHEDYYHYPGTRVTVCCLVVENGFSITGEAVCANPNQFDFTAGKRQARRNTLKRLKEYEHYLLRQRLYETGRVEGGKHHDPE